MNDLIPRAAAILIAERYSCNNGSALGKHSGVADCIASEIAALQAVDAVPVVRCRDCRYWRQEVTSTEHWICTQHSSDRRRMHTTPDFYCKDGMVSK